MFDRMFDRQFEDACANFWYNYLKPILPAYFPKFYAKAGIIWSQHDPQIFVIAIFVYMVCRIYDLVLYQHAC